MPRAGLRLVEPRGRPGPGGAGWPTRPRTICSNRPPPPSIRMGPAGCSIGSGTSRSSTWPLTAASPPSSRPSLGTCICTWAASTGTANSANRPPPALPPKSTLPLDAGSAGSLRHHRRSAEDPTSTLWLAVASGFPGQDRLQEDRRGDQPDRRRPVGADDRRVATQLVPPLHPSGPSTPGKIRYRTLRIPRMYAAVSATARSSSCDRSARARAAVIPGISASAWVSRRRADDSTVLWARQATSLVAI